VPDKSDQKCLNLLELFPSSNESFVARKTLGVRNPETGKYDGAEYVTYRRAVTAKDVELHLNGKVCLVAKPDLPDGTCQWAMIDHDIFLDDTAKLSIISKVGELKLPLHEFESKSGGLHSVAFFENPIPCEDARKLLSQWAAELGDPNAEIFPKPVMNGKLPFGIALPFFGEPERFTSFAPQRFKPPVNTNNEFARKNGDIPPTKPTTGSENVSSDCASVPGIAVPVNVNFEKLLRDHKLQFKTRVEGDATSFDYHAIGNPPQPCLIQGTVHTQNLGNSRCSRFLLRAGRVSHQCLDSDCQGVTEPKTRRALAALNIKFEEPEDDIIEIRNWPEPPSDAAFAGLVGEFTRLWQPHTEASPVALAAQFIAFYGHAIGRKPFFAVGGDDHHTNLEIALVGPTSFARKGQSYNCVKYTFDKVSLQLGVPYNEAQGLSSGEGLINAVRDPSSKTNKKGKSVIDVGVSDKRLLVFESEFASVLRRMVREGNTLSEVIRQAWDSGNLGTMTRNAPLRATNTHISVITHVTPSDLQLYLNDVSTMNGFANRFIFLATRRVCSLPDPGRPPDHALRAFAARLAKAIEFGEQVKEMKRSPDAVTTWESLYKKLSEPRTGRQHNAVVARGPAHVLRLSMIYALLDGSSIIEPRHLASASAIWDYAERTSRFVFGDSLGDKVAEKILELLKAESGGLTSREIRAKVTNKKQVPDALRLLHENGQVREESLKQTTAHRGQRWFAA
jgi:hypothetical protein